MMIPYLVTTKRELATNARNLVTTCLIVLCGKRNQRRRSTKMTILMTQRRRRNPQNLHHQNPQSLHLTRRVAPRSSGVFALLCTVKKIRRNTRIIVLMTQRRKRNLQSLHHQNPQSLHLTRRAHLARHVCSLVRKWTQSRSMLLRRQRWTLRSSLIQGWQTWL